MKIHRKCKSQFDLGGMPLEEAQFKYMGSRSVAQCMSAADRPRLADILTGLLKRRAEGWATAQNRAEAVQSPSLTSSTELEAGLFRNK